MTPIFHAAPKEVFVHPTLAASLLVGRLRPLALANKHVVPLSTVQRPLSAIPTKYFQVSEYCCTTGPLQLLCLLSLPVCKANSYLSNDAQVKCQKSL